MAQDMKKGSAEERREFRRRRRIRNQILAYLTLVVLVGAVVAGGVFGVKAVRGGKAQAAAETQTSAQEGTNATATGGTTEDVTGTVETPEDYIPEDFTPDADIAPAEGETPDTSTEGEIQDATEPGDTTNADAENSPQEGAEAL